MSGNRPYLRHLLMRRYEWMEERVLEHAAKSGYSFVTPAMARMFAHMGRKPIGISETAKRMAVSRQAIHQLAGEAANRGLIEIIDCESDRRLKLLRFTDKGWEMSAKAARGLASIEAELARSIGEDDLNELRRILSKAWPGDEERRS